MNIQIIQGAVGLMLLSVTFSACSEATATAPVHPVQKPTVDMTKPSNDAKELFSLDLYEPWTGAGHRILQISAASVTSAGLASLASTRAIDTGMSNNPIEVFGENFRCEFRPLVDDWTLVLQRSDVQVTISSQN